MEPTIVFQNLASAKITPHTKSFIVRFLTFHVCIKAMDFANADTYISFSKDVIINFIFFQKLMTYF
jgi:hypothetical protein